jgi:hypothetical protein
VRRRSPPTLRPRGRAHDGHCQPRTSHLELVQPLYGGRNAYGSAVIIATDTCNELTMHLSTAKRWRLVDVHQGAAKWPSTFYISLASRYSMNHPIEPHHRINIISLPKISLPTNTHILSCLPEYRLPASRPWRRPRCSSLSRLAAYSSSTRSFLLLLHACVRPKKQTAYSTLATSTWNTTRKEPARVVSC